MKKTYTILASLLVVTMITMYFVYPKQASAAWYNTSWDYRVKIEINPDYVDATLTSYPVYVDLSDLPAEFHTNVKSDGGDIRITESDEVTETPREVVFYNSVTDTGELYFLADSLSSSATSTFYIYYGNSGASDYAVDATYGAENVWNSNYLAVYHLHEAVNNNAGGYLDSTSNSNDATGSSMALTEVTGAVAGGNAQDFDGSVDYIDTGFVPPSGANARTLSAWVDVDTYKDGKFFGYGLNSGSGNTFDFTQETILSVNYVLFRHNSGNIRFPGVTTGFDLIHVVVPTGATMTNDVQIFINGSGATGTRNGGSDQTLNTYASNNMWIGSTSSYQTEFDGKIDEVRVMNTDLASTWISTEYNNQSSSNSFYYVAAEESQPVAPAGETRTIQINNGTIKINNGKLIIQ